MIITCNILLDLQDEKTPFLWVWSVLCIRASSKEAGNHCLGMTRMSSLSHILHAAPFPSITHTHAITEI